MNTVSRSPDVGPVFIDGDRYVAVQTITMGVGRWIDVYSVADQHLVRSWLLHTLPDGSDDYGLWVDQSTIITYERLSGDVVREHVRCRTLTVP